MIIDLFDPLVHQFLKEIENLGFSLCLVGGISRDYFYNYTQHSSFFQYGKMKFTNDLYAQIHLKSESLAVYPCQVAVFLHYIPSSNFHFA